jgi:hypothetical protein
VEIDLEDVERYQSLVPIFGAAEELFDAWETAVRELELETEPSKWEKVPNRVALRNARFGRGQVSLSRSRIRRRINRTEKKKGFWR